MNEGEESEGNHDQNQLDPYNENYKVADNNLKELSNKSILLKENAEELEVGKGTKSKK